MPFLAPLSTELTLLIVRFADKSPEPEDVKAGWTAFAIFLLLFAAVILLGFSLVKHLRKAQAAQDAGAYDGPTEDRTDDSSDRGDARDQQSS
jgi:hypothetical protein